MDAVKSFAPAVPGLLRHAGGLALGALFNPYTLFGRDDGAYWLGCFVLPLALSLLGMLAARPALCSGWPWLALIQLLLWADV
jgi:hypothetical protein